MKRLVLWAWVLVSGLVFANDAYLIVGTGKLVDKGTQSDLAKALSVTLAKEKSEPAMMDVIEASDAAAMETCAGKSYAGIVLIPGFDTPKVTDNSVVASEQLTAMRKLIDAVQTKAVVAVETGGDFENFRRLKDAFGGRAAIITTRDAEARLINFWGNYAPEGQRRIKLALAAASDPTKRDGLHPFPGKVTMEGTWMVVDYETPALRGKSLIVGDTLMRKFYVRSSGKKNWTRIDNAYIEGNKLYLDCAKIKNPGGVRLNWWGISPFKNVDHLCAPSFVIALDEEAAEKKPVVDAAPLPPDVQARMAAESEEAALVTEGLADDERAWTLNAYIPNDTIIYKVGDRPEAKIEVLDAQGRMVPAKALSNVVFRIEWMSDDGKVQEMVDLTENALPIRRVIELKHPGVKFFTATLGRWAYAKNGTRLGHMKSLKSVRKGKNGKIKKSDIVFRVGALFDPLKIVPGKPEPKDFDEQWRALMAKDEAEFGNKPPKLKRLRKTEKDGTQQWEVVLDSLGGEVFFDYSVPPAAQQGKKLPLDVYLQAYMVNHHFPESWHKWCLSIGPNCHSISNFQSSAYYKERARELVNFGFNTNENARIETCYHTRMLLRDLRAVRWAQSQPEWNGETITAGGSQGAFQAMALAGMIPEVVVAAGHCPWHVDIGRSDIYWRPKYQPGPAYADPVYWMSRTKARRIVYICGLADFSCPADGEMAMFNAIPDTCAEAHIYIYQSRAHDVHWDCPYPRYHFTKRFGKVTGELLPYGTPPSVRADSMEYFKK